MTFATSSIATTSTATLRLLKVLWLSSKIGRKGNKDSQLRSQLVESGQREKQGKLSEVNWLGN